MHTAGDPAVAQLLHIAGCPWALVLPLPQLNSRPPPSHTYVCALPSTISCLALLTTCCNRSARMYHVVFQCECARSNLGPPCTVCSCALPLLVHAPYHRLPTRPYHSQLVHVHVQRSAVPVCTCTLVFPISNMSSASDSLNWDPTDAADSALFRRLAVAVAVAVPVAVARARGRARRARRAHAPCASRGHAPCASRAHARRAHAHVQAGSVRVRGRGRGRGLVWFGLVFGKRVIAPQVCVFFFPAIRSFVRGASGVTRGATTAEQGRAGQGRVG